MLGLFLPAIKQAEARVDVSVDFFYDNIGSDGNWVEVADYGYCWQPSVAMSDSKWRPYSDGYWAYTDVGWTWVSNEDFGWATYHYGRWTRLRDRGWFWVPGREWGPAWVSWRTGGDYVGWAPLPPRGGRDVEYDNRPIHGQVDVEFDIGPEYYNFVDVRYIGEPVLRERIVEPRMNITYISNTVNVTNISYTNSVVYNQGPDYDTLSRYSARPIRRMTLERDSNVELSVAVQSKGLTRVQGDKLIVAAPLTFQKPSKPVAPKMVKEKIEKPTIERGWAGVSDPKAQADLKQKMKSEDAKNIPPPTIKPHDNAATAPNPASASPATTGPGTTPALGASPAAPVNPATTAVPATPAPAGDKGNDKGKDKRSENASPMPTAPSSLNPATTPPGKPKKERDEKPAPAMTPPLSKGPDTKPAPTPNKHAERQQTTPSSLVTSPDGTPYREPIDKAVKKDKRTDKAPDTMPPTRQPSDAVSEKAPSKPRDQAAPVAPNREAPPDAPRKKEIVPPKQEPVAQPPDNEASRKQPKSEPSRERTAPPPGPPGNEPAKAEAPHSKRLPDKKTNEPAPSPGS
jgi:hypothetical protein